MKTSLKIVSGSVALLVATLGLNAQATSQSSTTTGTKSSSTSSASPSTSSRSTATTPSGTTANQAPGTETQRQDDLSPPASATAAAANSSATASGPNNLPSSPSGASATGTATAPGTSTATSTTTPSSATAAGNIGQSGTTSGNIGQSGTTSANSSIGQSGTTGMQVGGGIAAQTSTTATATETQVTSIVQRIDTQGPAVVEKITTQFADVTCSPENARLIVDGLRNGTDITLQANGNTVTFKPTGAHLGYGEAYLTLALAAEALRNAGVTGCATPEQWKAVLLGGPLAAAGTSTTSTSTTAGATSSTHFPGILTLRSQGQGWGQVAQTTKVQLGQIVASANSSFGAGSDSGLTPTGKTSSEMMRDRMDAGKSSTAPHGQAKGQDDDDKAGNNGKAKGQDDEKNGHKDSTKSSTTPSTSPNP